jgi:hypothetical protein
MWTFDCCRDNAALTRKRQKIYADFLDRAAEDLTAIMSGDLDFTLVERCDESGQGDSSGRKRKPSSALNTTFRKKNN